MSKNNLLLLATTVIALFLRLINLHSIPPHLSNDEISIAYDAYSVAHTGRDEWGQFLPLSFRSHNTYKAPLLTYLTIPFNLLVGNNEYAVRLPSAILGAITIPLIYLLVFLFTKNTTLSHLSAILLTLTPWHIYTSRMGLESNIGLFFIVLSIYLFFCHRLLLSALSFSLSIYAYHTQWLLTPLLILILLAVNFQKIKKQPRPYLHFLLAFGIFCLPIFADFVNNLGTHARANTELLFREPTLQHQLNQTTNPLIKLKYFSNALIGSYLSYINFAYLFFDGLRLLPASNPYQAGLFLFPLLPFLLIGIYQAKNYFQKHHLFFYLWFFISPLVPALTIGGTNLVRNLVSLPPYIMAISVGLYHFLKKQPISLRISILSLVSFSFIYFSIIYYHHFPIESGEGFQYGYKQIALYIKNNYSLYDQIIVDPAFGDYNRFDGVPHLYIPYFTNMPPQNMLSASRNTFDKYQFRDINWLNEDLKPGTLFVTPVSDPPPSAISLKLEQLLEIQLPNFKPAFLIFTPK